MVYSYADEASAVCMGGHKGPPYLYMCGRKGPPQLCLVARTHPRLPGRMGPPATAWSHGPTRDCRVAWTHPRLVGPTHPRGSGGVGMAADSLYKRGSIFSFHHTNLVFRGIK